MNTHVLAPGSGQFLSPLLGTKLRTIEYCLNNVTKHFIVLFYFVFLLFFFFLFYYAGSVGESAYRNFS